MVFAHETVRTHIARGIRSRNAYGRGHWLVYTERGG